MPGPSGELCQDCYYWEQGAAPDHSTEYGLCRGRLPENVGRTQGRNSLAAAARKQPHWSPTFGAEDWCTNWTDKTTGLSGQRATGAFVTPRDTGFSITDPANWIKYDPGNLYAGSIMKNFTLADGVLTWTIPGTYPEGTEFEAFASLYGSVTFPSPSTFIEITVGTDGVPYNQDTVQRLEVNPQTDDLSLAYSLQGLGVGTQNGEAEMLVRGDIGAAAFTSAVLQLRVQRV